MKKGQTLKIKSQTPGYFNLQQFARIVSNKTTFLKYIS